ncbi:sn1-specific diacylglycerol lipase beta-like [Dorcoceras hygrometricum]|uniref:Sn1-specific diacylglycerol lipase beta-like n=1 Tax=Dorcoceras hygrometricum TaxID=472368 RepID=A0A2Z7AF24_9LAMI|nr:sn1-specific diacylglycerol lipase beta-like [Dorcoceras hygrometricum]
MQHAKIDAMKCMTANKGRIARPVNQLENHLSRASIPRTVYQPGKSLVRDLQSPSAHHSSVVFRHNQTVGHHSDDSVGLFRHNSSVGQSQRGSQIRSSINLSNRLKMYASGHAKQLNDVVRDTSPLLPTAEQKRYTQNTTFQLNKTTSPLQQQLRNDNVSSLATVPLTCVDVEMRYMVRLSSYLSLPLVAPHEFLPPVVMHTYKTKQQPDKLR